MAREDEIPKRARRSLENVQRKAKKKMEREMRLCGKTYKHPQHHYPHWVCSATATALSSILRARRKIPRPE